MGLDMNKPQYKVYNDVTKKGDLYITLSRNYDYMSSDDIEIYDVDDAKYFIEELIKFVNEIERKYGS